VRDSQRLLYFSKRELRIHCSGPNLDSGLFRVIQYHSSTRAKGGEKTGMTVFGVVLYKRHNALIQVFLMLPLFALYVVLLFVAPKVPLFPGEVPDEA